MSPCFLDIPCDSSLIDKIVVNETPIGAKNCFNNSFTTRYPFIEDTLEVYVDGIKIDLSGFTQHIDLQGFTFIIDPNDSKKLNRPIMNTETLTVNYLKKAISSCIKTI